MVPSVTIALDKVDANKDVAKTKTLIDGAVAEMKKWETKLRGEKKDAAADVLKNFPARMAPLQAAAVGAAKMQGTDHEYKAKIEQTIAYKAPWPVRTDDFAWDVGFMLKEFGTVLQVQVRILAMIGTKAIDATQQNMWKTHIQSVWNIAQLHDGAKKLDIQFDLVWLKKGDKTAHYEVTVKSPPLPSLEMLERWRNEIEALKKTGKKADQLKVEEIRDIVAGLMDEETKDLKIWGSVDRVAVAHEFGHMIGCPDEYFVTKFKNWPLTYDAKIYNKPPYDTTEPVSLMNIPTKKARIYERHFSLIKAAWDDWKGTKTSKIVITKPAPVGG
jgi:hypothetical protein